MTDLLELLGWLQDAEELCDEILGEMKKEGLKEYWEYSLLNCVRKLIDTAEHILGVIISEVKNIG
ncbi:MAG: hypothetical protein J7L20_03750 [Thermoplasmata archaeon]|nr:hypothetical protein [Thermoplasmata archaeon]